MTYFEETIKDYTKRIADDSAYNSITANEILNTLQDYSLSTCDAKIFNDFVQAVKSNGFFKDSFLSAEKYIEQGESDPYFTFFFKADKKLVILKAEYREFYESDAQYKFIVLL